MAAMQDTTCDDSRYMRQLKDLSELHQSPKKSIAGRARWRSTEGELSSIKDSGVSDSIRVALPWIRYRFHSMDLDQADLY